MIICLIGPSCAGKTTTAEYLLDEYGFQFIEGSDIVVERYDHSSSEQPVLDYVKSQYQEHGKDTFAQPVLDAADELDGETRVISGFRTSQEIEYVKGEFGVDDTIILGIYANSILRYQRKISRDRVDPSYGYIDFLKKDFAEYHFGIAKIMETKLDDIIINEGTFSQLYSTIDDRISTVL